MSTQDKKPEETPGNEAGQDQATPEPTLPKPTLPDPVVEETPTEKFDLIEPEIQETAELHDPTTQVLITPTAEDIAKASAGQGYIDQSDPNGQNADRQWVPTGSPEVGYQADATYGQGNGAQGAVPLQAAYPAAGQPHYSAAEQQMLAPSAPYYPTAPPAIAVVEEKTFGNLGFSISMAVVSTIVFAAALFGAYFLMIGAGLMTYLGDIDPMTVIAYPSYYFPVIAFLIGSLVVNLIGSKLGWWFHVLAGYLVAALVAAGLVFGRVYEESAWTEAGMTWEAIVAAPAMLVVVLIAMILAREIPLWLGALVAGRAAKQRDRKAEYAVESEKKQEELAARYAADQGIAQQSGYGQQYDQQYGQANYQGQAAQQGQQGQAPYQQPPYPTGS